MDLYFQSGEFYNDKSLLWGILELLVAFLGIVAGALVSIYVFWKGQRVESNKEKERLNSLETFVKSYVRDLKTPIQKQVNSIEDTIKKLESISEQDYTPDNLANLHLKGLSWIHRGDLYKVFVTRKIAEDELKAQLFRDFNSKCDYIEAFKSDYIETFNLFMKRYEKYENDWNQNFKLITQLRNKMNREFLSKIKEDDKHTYPFIEPFNKLFIDWTKVADFREPGVASKAFLRPLIRLCENSKMDDNTLKFIEVGNECLYANDNLIALKAFVKTNLDNMNKKLLQAGEILSKIVDKYDEIRTDNKEAPSFLNFLFRRT